MSIEPPREHESTYFVQDRENQEEMDRLEIQDTLVTAGMGGVLPELSDPSSLRRMLDVGCGTGGWLMEVARTYPTLETLIGADISDKMLEYARAKALAQDLDRRVQFQATDALRALPFSEHFFDLVNLRFGISWLRTWEWKKLLLEFRRVCRPYGIIRITENKVALESSSPALTKLWDILRETAYNSGRLFTPDSDGLISELVRLMTQQSIQDIQTRTYPLVYRAGTESGQNFSEDMLRMFHVSLPFFRKWTRVPDDYEEIYQQALKEMQEPDFVAIMTLLTVWGTTPAHWP